MIVDDALARIGSANFSHRSMGMDTECDLAVDAGGDPARARGHSPHPRSAARRTSRPVSGCRRARDRARRIDRRVHRYASERRAHARPDRHVRTGRRRRRRCFGLPPIRTSPWRSAPRSNRCVPAVDATSGRSPLRIWILPARCPRRPRPPSRGGRPIPSTRLPDAPSALWIGAGASSCWRASLLIPLELLAIAAGVVFRRTSRRSSWRSSDRWPRPSSAMLPAGRLARQGFARWMSRRSYRRSGSWVREAWLAWSCCASPAWRAPARFICSAVRGEFRSRPIMAGTVIGLVPAIAALSGLGGLLRHTLLNPSVSNAIDHHRRSRAPVRVGIGTASVSPDSSVCAVSLQPSRPGGVRLVACAGAAPGRDLQRARVCGEGRTSRSGSRGDGDRRTERGRRRAAGVHVSSQRRAGNAHARRPHDARSL